MVVMMFTQYRTQPQNDISSLLLYVVGNDDKSSSGMVKPFVCEYGSRVTNQSDIDLRRHCDMRHK